MPSLLQLAIGFEGLSLLRGWPFMSDAEIEQRVAELRCLVEAPLHAFDAPERDVHAGYGAWSANYDEPGNPVIAIEEPVVRRLLDALPLGRALDAACGTGRHAAYLASLGHDVVAADTTLEMLRSAPVPNRARSDVRALPLASATLDAAVSSLALTHLDDLIPPVAEMARVVKPGGVVVLSDIHPSAVMLGTQAMYRASDGTRGFVRNHHHPVGAYLAAFRKAGLEVLDLIEPVFTREHAIALMPSTIGAYPSVREALESALAGTPAIIVWHLVRRAHGDKL